MRLLADENLPQAIIARLRTDGHDVARVQDLSPAVADDQVAVLTRALDRVLMTQDKDFGDLIFRNRVSIEPGVVLLRLGAMPPSDMAARVGSVLPMLPDLTDRLVVVDPRRVRVRWFPRVVK